MFKEMDFEMYALQIDRYAKNFQTVLRDLPTPEIGPKDVLVKVKAAAVNPLELLIATGSVRLIQDYPMPLTLGNECSGTVEQVGKQVTRFRPGDKVYARLPLARIGAFAEYVAVEEAALAAMPRGYDFDTAAAIPLTGLTAWQALKEELEVVPGRALLIPGGSGSFGQMAIPLAKALGMHVIVTGNAKARDAALAAGADQYLDFKRENYWENLSEMDYVIDTLGAGEFEHELSVLKPGGRLVSLRTGPNRLFADRNRFGPLKRFLFTAAGAKYDRAAKQQGKEYRFLFVRSDGAQLGEITKLVEKNHIVPRTDPRQFTLDTAQDALRLVKQGGTDGKVIIRF